MAEVARIWFTPKQKAKLWERWRAGPCVTDIARALERRNKSGVQRILALGGGISPRVRRRATGALRPEEREEIAHGIAAGRSMRRIAARLGRAPSSVSREIKRHGGRAPAVGGYARESDEYAEYQVARVMIA
jgi:DNA-binding CsgD family transcriptional regulator